MNWMKALKWVLIAAVVVTAIPFLFVGIYMAYAAWFVKDVAEKNGMDVHDNVVQLDEPWLLESFDGEKEKVLIEFSSVDECDHARFRMESTHAFEDKLVFFCKRKGRGA